MLHKSVSLCDFHHWCYYYIQEQEAKNQFEYIFYGLIAVLTWFLMCFQPEGPLNETQIHPLM